MGFICCVLEQAIVRQRKLQCCDTTERKERCSSPLLRALCHRSYPPWDMTQNISTHHKFQAVGNFCSDSSVVEAHLAKRFAYLLYTSICFIVQVFFFKHHARMLSTSPRTQRQLGKRASSLLSLCQQSETRSNISVYPFIYALVRAQNAGAEGSR